MSKEEAKEPLIGIYLELKRLNDNIEKIVEKIESSVEEDNSSVSYDEWKIEADKKKSKNELWLIAAVVIGFIGFAVYDKFFK